MMIKLLFTCLFILGFVNCFGQFTNDFHKETVPNGKIDSVVTTISVKYSLGIRDTSELIGRSTEVYNKKKQLIESKNCSYLQPQHSAVDSRPVKTAYIYDTYGNLTESHRYFTTGEPWVKDTFSKKGSIVTARRYYCPDNRLTGTATLKLDFSDRISECDSYVRGGGLFTRSYFKYNKAGLLITEDTFSANGSLMFKHTCIYNADGDLIEDNNPFGDREIHSYKYENYDKIHNWLKQTEYRNNQPFKIRERTIAYY